MSYLEKLRGLKNKKTPATPTAQTEKTTSNPLYSVCAVGGRGILKNNFAISDFDERLAILIESGGHEPDKAHELAMKNLGGDQLEHWRYHIERLPPPNTGTGCDLIQTATGFLKTPAAAMAAFYGWNELEVFGVFNGPSRAMVHRLDATGLVPALAWSRIGSKLVDLDEDRAIIETRSGNKLNHHRQMTGQQYAVPVWWSGI